MKVDCNRPVTTFSRGLLHALQTNSGHEEGLNDDDNCDGSSMQFKTEMW